MPLKDVVKVSRKTFFNPTGWLGVEMLRTQFTTSWDILKRVLTPPMAGREETFEQAVSRFQLTNEKINEIAKNFLIYSIIFLTCGILTLIFSLYLLIHHASFAGLLLGLATAAVFFAYAFRYSFWRFEIKHQKLGCTFEEWLHNQPKKEV